MRLVKVIETCVIYFRLENTAEHIYCGSGAVSSRFFESMWIFWYEAWMLPRLLPQYHSRVFER
ncbi:hypothetical protein KC19_2G158100 [Ceratodon purpureus]|uniref:Uncharacterized protein n=1 Tax=Ceratodon purpureus TaxID=3225 RepID=A0A8T0IUD4_CERPU|nr:hypothetical protein KC19_2G158100 [Ceratodon purpureus]